MMATLLKNVVVVGGSYVGKGTAQRLAESLPPAYRVLLIEPHTHFHHLFTFPRFAIVPGYEHKAFVPYTTTFASSPSPKSHAIVAARAVAIHDGIVALDREFEGASEIPFEYLVVATGTTLAQPCAMKDDDKASGVAYLGQHQEQVRQARSIVIAGGGAAGVQMACDIKEYFPDKSVTLVQSRDKLMPVFHRDLHDLISRRFAALDIKLVTGRRVQIPSRDAATASSTPPQVELSDGTKLDADLVIAATGQKPNNALVAHLPPSNGQSIINPVNGMIRVRPTLQFADARYPNLFAVGDIADTGAHKAARPGSIQAAVVAANIAALVADKECTETFSPSPAGIHLSLGLKYNIIFGNPAPEEGRHEPRIVEKFDGTEDMNVENLWKRMGLDTSGSRSFHL